MSTLRRDGRCVTAVLVVAAVLTLAGCGGSGVPPAEEGNTRTEAGTLSLSVTPHGSASDPTPEVLLATSAPDAGVSGVRVVKDGAFLRFTFSDDTGNEHGISTSIATWKAGESHAIASTWDAGVVRFYIDGELVNTATYSGLFNVRPEGSDPSSGSSLVQVYNRPLTPEEIALLAKLQAPFPLATPIQLSTPVAPNLPRAELRVQSTTIEAAQSAGALCMELVDGGGRVAGTQNDLTWDPACIAIFEPCQANPQQNKSVNSRQFDAGWLRTLFFAFDNVNTIDDGVLYCCPFSFRSGACCTIGVQRVIASDPQGERIPMEGIGGSICRR